MDNSTENYQFPGVMATADQKATMEATIIRKDGRRQKLGIVVGGNWFQTLLSKIKIKYYNFLTNRNAK